MHTFEILGKKYQVQSSLNPEETDKINGEIVKRLKSLTYEYPTLDKIDILILYIIELKEKISILEKTSSKEAGRLDNIRNKISLLEKKITEEIKNLDVSKKVL